MHRVSRGWVAAVALLTGPLLAEGIARLQYGDSRPIPAMFAPTEDVRIGLAANLQVEGRTPDGRTYSITTDATGHRAPSPTSPVWVLTGDSLAFGLGVADGETTAVRLTALGLPTRSVAVPGFSLADALTEADAAVGDSTRGVVVWVNPVDDDRQAHRSDADSRAVVAGHAVHADTPGPLRTLLASPLAGSQVVSTLVHALGIARQVAVHGFGHVGFARAADGGADDFAALGAAIAAFAHDHPCATVVALWAPLPGVAVPDRASPSALERTDLPLDDASALAGLRRGLGTVPLLDVSDVLAGRSDAFLPADTHLSAAGHQWVAEALAAHLPPPRQSCP